MFTQSEVPPFQLVVNVRCVPSRDGTSSFVVENAAPLPAFSSFDHRKNQVQEKLKNPDLPVEKRERLMKKLCSLVAQQQLSASESEGEGKRSKRAPAESAVLKDQQALHAKELHDKLHAKVRKLEEKLVGDNIPPHKRERIQAKISFLQGKKDESPFRTSAEKNIAKLEASLATADLPEKKRLRLAAKLAQLSGRSIANTDPFVAKEKGEAKVEHKLAKLNAKLADPELSQKKREKIAAKISALACKTTASASVDKVATRQQLQIAKINDKLAQADLPEEKRQRLSARLSKLTSQPTSAGRQEKLEAKRERLLGQLAAVEEQLAALRH